MTKMLQPKMIDDSSPYPNGKESLLFKHAALLIWNKEEKNLKDLLRINVLERKNVFAKKQKLLNSGFIKKFNL